MRTLPKALVVPAVVLALAACEKSGDAASGEEPPGAAPTAEPEKPAPDDPSGGAAAADDDAVPEHLVTMDHNFNSARFLVDALVAGELAVTKAYAVEVTKLPMAKKDDPVWTNGLTRVKDAAAVVVTAAEKGDLAATAAATGQMLTACTACHRSLKGPSAASPDDPPVPDGTDVKGVKPKVLMAQHQWAFDRILDGLYVPSDENWKVGTTAYQRAFLVAPADRKEEKKAVAMETAVRAMKLDTLDTDVDRAKAWSELVVGCVACHQEMHVKLKPPDMP